MEENIELLLESASNHTREAVTALFEMHEVVSFCLAGLIDENNDDFQKSLADAHYFATQTRIDADNIDDKLKLTVVKLMILAKTAHTYFATELAERSAEIEMLLRATCFEIMNDIDEIE